MDKLLSHLETCAPGPLGDLSTVESMLAECWDQFAGSAAGGMAAYKLNGRMEAVEWNPPSLSFDLERHGPTVLGSSLAKIQAWTVNFENRTASMSEDRSRVVGSRNPRLDVQPLAEEVYSKITARAPDHRLKWNDDLTVKVLIGKIIPDDAPKQTVEGRRKRFRSRLEELLRVEGWHLLSPNKFRPPDSDSLNL